MYYILVKDMKVEEGPREEVISAYLYHCLNPQPSPHICGHKNYHFLSASYKAGTVLSSDIHTSSKPHNNPMCASTMITNN